MPLPAAMPRVLAGLVAMASLSRADAPPALPYIGGGLTIMTPNQLNSAPNDGSGAILLSQPASNDNASASCKTLGEMLWNPDTANFHAGLNSSLAYQVYQGLATTKQNYWIAKPSAAAASAPCRAITALGVVVDDLDCQMALPVLCTQTAPLSSALVDNPTAPWLVRHTIDNAELTGYRDYHVFKFRGLRFAAPPARFTYSTVADISTWNGEGHKWNATTAGADCSQPLAAGETQSTSSEDCLFANVWTPFLPKTADTAGGAMPPRKQLKPVMLYYYGGGLRTGSGKSNLTDGTNIASRGDVVVVSVNYRVGALGFMVMDDTEHKGNYAVSDMITALEWVKKYIKFFGGDPDRVTLFGESSGAQAIHLVMGSPKAKGLFHAAITQSGPDGWPKNGKPGWQTYVTPRTSYLENTQRVLNETKCHGETSADEIACLVDSLLVVNQSSASYTTNVSLMTGFNRDVTAVLVKDYPANGESFGDYFNGTIGPRFSFPNGTTNALLKDIPTATSPEPDVGQGLTLPGSGSSPEQIFNVSMRIATGAVFGCYNMAKAYSGARSGSFRSVYAFVFNRTYSPPFFTKPWCDAPPVGPQFGEYYKGHGGEQPIVFGTARRLGLPDRDGLDGPFMRLVVDYWTAFARSGGDPNPDPGYLQARGYWDTAVAVGRTRIWEAVKGDSPMMRMLQWEGMDVPFVQQDVCKQLGAPMNVLEVPN